jgi:hypothetical protein
MRESHISIVNAVSDKVTQVRRFDWYLDTDQSSHVQPPVSSSVKQFQRGIRGPFQWVRNHAVGDLLCICGSPGCNQHALRSLLLDHVAYVLSDR